MKTTLWVQRLLFYRLLAEGLLADRLLAEGLRAHLPRGVLACGLTVGLALPGRVAEINLFGRCVRAADGANASTDPGPDSHADRPADNPDKSARCRAAGGCARGPPRPLAASGERQDQRRQQAFF